jgi:hypothetical protein
MRIYFCDCGKRVEISKGEVKKCDCGKVFGSSSSISDHINMRTTWSSQTKVEFNETTMDESIRKMNNG